MAIKKDIRCRYSYFDRVTIRRTDKSVRFTDPETGKPCARKAWAYGLYEYVYLRGTYYKLSQKAHDGLRTCINEYDEVMF